MLRKGKEFRIGPSNGELARDRGESNFSRAPRVGASRELETRESLHMACSKCEKWMEAADGLVAGDVSDWNGTGACIVHTDFPLLDRADKKPYSTERLVLRIV